MDEKWKAGFAGPQGRKLIEENAPDRPANLLVHRFDKVHEGIGNGNRIGAGEQHEHFPFASLSGQLHQIA